MKVQCDVCQKAEASVFCCADEAALCLKCDSNIHDANKLASKHPRVSLLDPQQKFPRCDICQEKRAFFFCREDRALLCRDCDFSVHSSNGLTAKHGRFFVSGIKVSLDVVETPSPSLSTSLAGGSGSASASASVNNKNEMEITKRIGMEKAATATAESVVNKRPRANPLTDLPVFLPKQSENTTDDISQYLNQVEEFLGSSSPARLDWFAIGDSSKGEDIGKSLAADWAADLGLPVEALYGDSLAEVPHTPSPSTSMDSGICSYTRLGIVMKQKPRHHHQQQQSHLFHFNTLNTADDIFLVPDVGSISPNKRIRPF